MTQRYAIGLCATIVIAVGSLALKAVMTEYPGVGDFALFSSVVQFVPSWLSDRIYDAGLDLRAVSYVAKTCVAILSYTLLYFALKRMPGVQIPLAVGVTAIALACMSIGEVVVA